ncbi:ATP-binding protein [Clostridium sp. MB05]
MLSKKTDYRHKGVMSNIFIPVLLVLTIINLSFEMVDEYAFVTRILCFSISVLIFIISIIKINNKDLGIIRYMGIGYFYIAIVRFIELEQMFNNHKISMTLNFIQLITYLEIINIISSIILFKKKYSPKVQNIVFILVIPIIFAIIESSCDFLNIRESIYIFDKPIIINGIIMIILLFLIIYIYNKMNIDIRYKWVIHASLFIVLSNCFILLTAILDKDLWFFVWIIKLSSYFFVYDKVEEALLYNSYEGAYENLNRAKKIKINLNKSLKRREKELKELNLLLEKSEKKYYDVVQAFSDGVLVFEDDILMYSNYSGELHYNTPGGIIYDKDKLRLNNILSKITEEEYSVDDEVNEFTAQISVVNENGEIKELEIDLVKIYNNKKILMFNDVTEIIKQREEIVKLEKTINDENIKEEFYSNISHELRTPINVIYSALQLNDIYLKKCEIEKINRNNNVIKQNCLRLIRTINNFMDSNKLSEGYLDVDKKVYNIVDIIENVVLSCNFYMEFKETKLTFDPQYEEIYFYCDKNCVERIMLNILSNSLKYGKYKGNIYVILRIDDKKNIVIEVMNDAEAIPEDKRKVIFDKFTKVNTSLNRPSEGSGLGLFLTKGLVELHEGEITIAAGKKYGNIFKITFPYKDNIRRKSNYINNNVEINELQEKVNIEFSDIYF